MAQRLITFTVSASALISYELHLVTVQIEQLRSLMQSIGTLPILPNDC
jgi:hypothetical protein